MNHATQQANTDNIKVIAKLWSLWSVVLPKRVTGKSPTQNTNALCKYNAHGFHKKLTNERDILELWRLEDKKTIEFNLDREQAV